MIAQRRFRSWRQLLSREPGPQTELTERIEATLSAGRAILVGRAAQGLVAVLLAWRAQRAQCRVALPAAVCHEVLLAVLVAGCEPIFCDVALGDGLVTRSEWLRARHAGAEVAIVVHLYGNPANTSEVKSIFSSAQCLVIDDAAQALGSRSAEGPCGGLGDVGLISFGHSKQISIANAAVLVRDSQLADRIEAIVQCLPTVESETRAALSAAFRLRLDAARARLVDEGSSASGAFAGLLDEMQSVLGCPLNDQVYDQLSRALEVYPGAMKLRVEKARLWDRFLQPAGFLPVGMGIGCVPWRYTCRLPGISWAQQSHVAEAIRGSGIHVSTWYLPAHWFAGEPAGSFPGAERLAQEVFQFWVNDEITSDSIPVDARTVVQHVMMQRSSGHIP